MKQKIINDVLGRMARNLDGEQLADLKLVLAISLEGYKITKEKMELSTHVIDNDSYLRKYLQSLVIAGKADGTIKNYRLHIQMLLDDIRKPIKEISESDLLEHLARQKYRRNLSNRYLDLKRMVFRSFFNWLVKRRYIKENPALLLDKIKYDSTIRKPFSDEEREKLRCACDNLRDVALTEMLYSTGCRVSEITLLNKEDIDFKNNSCVVLGKGKKERVVYLNERTVFHLKKYLTSRIDVNPALFVANRFPYGRLSKTGIEAILRRLGKIAEVPDVYPHRFRRTTLTNALNRGMPLQDVQEMAGHSTPNTTMIYCALDKYKIKEEHRRYLAS